MQTKAQIENLEAQSAGLREDVFVMLFLIFAEGTRNETCMVLNITPCESRILLLAGYRICNK